MVQKNKNESKQNAGNNTEPAKVSPTGNIKERSIASSKKNNIK